MTNNITVYTTSSCPYCVMMKNFLQENGLPFKEVNVQVDQVAARKLVEATGQMGVPQTNINGTWILGYNPEAVLSAIN